MGLLPTATEDSHIRYKIAQALANLAPPSFGQESVLTGSASRGVASPSSMFARCPRSGREIAKSQSPSPA
jgi:hypothetical protein